MLLKVDPHLSCQPRGSKGLPDTGRVSGSTAFTPDPDRTKRFNFQKQTLRLLTTPTHPQDEAGQGRKGTRTLISCCKPLKADARQAWALYPLAWAPSSCMGPGGRAHTRAQT